jgi:hypothetical protein
MRKNEKGFGALEILVILVLVGLIVSVLWYVLSKQKDTGQKSVDKDTSTSQNSPTENDPLKLEATTVELLSGVRSEAPLVYGSASTQSVISDFVSFATPDVWRPDAEFTSEGCGKADCIGQSVIVPADEDTSVADYPDYFAVTISAFKTNQDAKNVFSSHWQDDGEAAEQAYSIFTTNDGKKGFKYDFAFNGNDNKGRYVEHVAYGISRAGIVVILDVTYFNGSNKSFANTNQTDYGQYAAEVEQIAKSLRILR